MDQIYIRRLNHFYHWMEKNQLQGVMITSPANIYYLTNFYSNPHERFMGLFLLKNQEPILILPELDLHEAKRLTFLKHLYGYSDSEGPELTIIKHIHVSSDLPFGIETDNISFKTALWLKQLLNITDLVDIESGLMNLRLVKDQLELSYMKEAAKWADRAIQIGINAVQIGKSELQIIADIEYQLKKQGIEKMSFDTMVLAGEKSALPHGKPGKETVKKGDFVLFDLGVVINGYCSDISRTIIVGSPTEKQKEIYLTVKNAQQIAINEVRPDIPLKQIDLAARNYITEKGYGEFFMHRIGHGLGLDIHESPSVHHKNNSLIINGMVFTIEPGIYLPAIGGVRIEDDIYVSSERAELLTSFTKELIEL